ncbi:YfiT family bacillithiol transferase [Hufsiella ginkgonis]|uniref:Putative metal-dependent hydrolase n=1 Tax=Hufsiella ginkgonis TaxID=2695274 RepID=A0A7K1XV06_9SPHI|nr:putative metal-dependent hydrolase [Hufsiella ginkgonis]MXV14628.1 putative metal-dependent hydrolase [Hufsiella ginkgonis]
MTTQPDLRYPIGKYVSPAQITPEQVDNWIAEIAMLPAKMHDAAAGLTDEQLDMPYRPGGWTLRQVFHHVPDSHANAYIRFKLGITEDRPTIRPYFEDRWAETEDGKFAPVQVSLNLLDALHQRWVLFLRSLTPADLERTYVHPEHGKTFVLKDMIGMYVWHGEHHLQQVMEMRRRNGW